MLPHRIINKPELLAPAGDMERLIMAVHYGADAVYLAGKAFGMRAASLNFSNDELENAIEYAHSRGVRAYVACNTIPRQDELPALKEYLSFLSSIPVDALIITDLGVFALCQEYAPDIAKHISTQMGVLNSCSADYLYSLGADTVVLARECSMKEIKSIRENVDPALRLEAFVHGAMCVSFSGRCLLSNYLNHRDANRGECTQPCRWKYHLLEEKRPDEYFEISEDGGTYILNSHDMRMIEHIPELIEAGVDSLKIEGRMKSAYYTAVITNAYRHAIDDACSGQPFNPIWVRETETVSHRNYSTGFYFGNPGENYSESSYTSLCDIVAVVEECDEQGNAVLSREIS